MKRGPGQTSQLRSIWPLGLLVVSFFIALFLSGCAAKAPEAISLEPSIEGELQPVHPDEPVDQTFNVRFSLQSALTGLSRVKEMSVAPSGEAGMAYVNSLGAMEGTLRKQDYEIRKLEFELAKFQYRDGQISKEQLDEKEAAYRTAVEDFKSYWSSFGISD